MKEISVDEVKQILEKQGTPFVNPPAEGGQFYLEKLSFKEQIILLISGLKDFFK